LPALFQEVEVMDYRHLTDEELIHYVLLDAQPGTLAGVLAQRYADNVCNVAELEKSHQEEIENLTDAHAHELSEIKDAHEVEITELEDAHAYELSEIEDAHSAEITELENAALLA
jgi:hypothetical protein